jgi:hypothetical protein
LLKHSNIRRTLAAAAIGALLSGIFALSAPAASWAEGAEARSGTSVSSFAGEVGLMAHPSGCRAEIPADWGSVATCSRHNGGSFRALVLCRHRDGRITDDTGPWMRSGWSRAYCEGDSKAVTAGFETSYYDRT